MTTLKRYAAALAATLLATPAAAQKADRHPDPDLDGPRVVRTIPITPSFDRRWFGPPQSDHWISHKPPPSDRFTPGVAYRLVEPQNVSTALPAAVGIFPVPGNRLRHDPPGTSGAVASPVSIEQEGREAGKTNAQRPFRTLGKVAVAVGHGAAGAGSRKSEMTGEALKKAVFVRPEQATCLRHNLKTVWSGPHTWRCRK